MTHLISRIKSLISTLFSDSTLSNEIETNKNIKNINTIKYNSGTINIDQSEHKNEYDFIVDDKETLEIIKK